MFSTFHDLAVARAHQVQRSRGFSSSRALFPDGERTTGVHAFCEELVVRR